MTDVRSFNPSPTVDQYLRRDASPITTGPLILHARVRPTAAPSGTHTILCVGQEAADRAYRIGLHVTVGWFAQTRGATATPFASSAFGSINQWYDIIGIFLSDTSRVVIVNGVASSVNTTSQGATSLDRISVAALYSAGGFSNVFEGQIADCGLYSNAFDHTIEPGLSNVASLATKLSPEMVRRDILAAVWRLRSGDSDADYFGSNNLTAINTPTYATQEPGTFYLHAPKGHYKTGVKAQAVNRAASF